MTILLALPSYDGWLRHELLPFIAEANAAGATVLPLLHLPVDVARNQAVVEARRRKCDILVTADSDAAPRPGTFDALVAQARREPCVVGVPYCSAGGAICVQGYDYAAMVNMTGVMKVQNLGGHVVAYRVEVFDRIPAPWYEHQYSPNHSVLTDSEDTVCHRKLRQAGVPLYVDFTRWCGHVKERTIGRPVEVTP